ncbi:MAG: LEA type 2 family protein [Syntrophales bacterium]|jgi:LEA14-like dessication related protein
MKNLNAKKWMATLGILFLLTLSICLVSCLTWIMEKPSFVLREIILSPSSFTEANLLIGLDVQNPNRFDLTLKSFEYGLFLDNEEIGTGRLEKEILVPSSSTTQVQVSVVAKFKDLGGSLKTIIIGHDLPYKIEGKASVKTAFGSRSFPFSKDGRINLKIF